MSCLFCKIANGEIPADIVHEDETIVAFRDVAPQAPHHILVIPRKHIASVNEATEADAGLLGQLQLTASRLAKDLGVAEEGFRLVMNCNAHGGQTVFHLHLHLLAGRVMHWPPG